MYAFKAECAKALPDNPLANTFLQEVKYYNTDIDEQSAKRERQQRYFEVLKELDGVLLIKGRFHRTNWHCPHYQEVCRQGEKTCTRCPGLFTSRTEKMTDVNIAISMIQDAFYNRYDVAMLISGDNDLKPAIELIKEIYPEKRVVIAFPPGRSLKELKDSVHASYKISLELVKRCQLPRQVQLSTGEVITCPEKYEVSRPLVLP